MASYSTTKEKYFKLDKFRCPAEGCKSEEQHCWRCAKDNTQTYISQKGYIRCSKSRNPHRDLLCNWRWDCGNHGRFFQWRSADLEGYTWALSVAVQQMGKNGANWVGELCFAIGEQFPNKKKDRNPMHTGHWESDSDTDSDWDY